MKKKYKIIFGLILLIIILIIYYDLNQKKICIQETCSVVCGFSPYDGIDINKCVDEKTYIIKFFIND